MDIWYANIRTEVWMLTKYFRGQGKMYEDRGWTTWERTVSNLLSMQDNVLDLVRLNQDRIDIESMSMQDIRGLCNVGRGPPIIPDEFNHIIQNKYFTCGESDLPLIKHNYTRNFGHALSFQTCCKFNSRTWCTSEWLSLFRALPHFTSLEALSLDKNGICGNLASKLSESLKHCSKLQKLHLNENQICDEGACRLAKALLHMCRSLFSLGLCGNKITGAGACKLGEALKHCTNLEYLGLGGNQICDEGACALAGSLVHICSGLHWLNLEGNIITDAGACNLGGALKNCPKLKYLKLGHSQMCDEGACRIAEAIVLSGQSLLHLSFVGNKISHVGACTLGETLKHFTNFKNLLDPETSLKMMMSDAEFAKRYPKRVPS